MANDFRWRLIVMVLVQEVVVVDPGETLEQAIQGLMVAEMVQRPYLCDFDFAVFDWRFCFCLFSEYFSISNVNTYLCQWRWFRLIRHSFHISISADSLCHTRWFDLAQINAAWRVCERLFIFCHHCILYAWWHFMLWLRLYSSCWYRSIHRWWWRWWRRAINAKQYIFT